MRFAGTLVEWNDARGFGWIAVPGSKEPVFVHISAFVPRLAAGQRPQVGWHLEFELALRDGKQQARPVRRSVSSAAAAAPSLASKSASRAAKTGRRMHHEVEGGGETYFALIAFVVIYLAVAMLWGVSAWVAAAYLVMSVLTYMAYGWDKQAASQGRWRTKEDHLHMLALLGGWPGALWAQQRLRHKTRKQSFRVVFWLTVILNSVAFVILHSPWGKPWLQALLMAWR